jgi:tetratricopeptide (TPR) repeat protein
MLKALARLFRRGSAHIDADRPAAVAAASHDVEALLAPCRAAVDAGRDQEATDLLEALLDSYPDLSEAHLLLGTIHHRRKNFDDARDSYLLAACFMPDSWRPHYRLGLLQLDEGKFEIAAQTLRSAVAAGANNPHVHNALGVALLHLGNASAAVEEFRIAVALQPDFVQAHSNLGHALFKDLEQYDEGARHIEHALELAPSDIAALSNRIMLLQHRGRFDEALALADELLARDAELVEARLNKALMLLTKGDFEHAWPYYEARKRSRGAMPCGDLPCPEWNGASLERRSVYVYAEQGLGDQIMFASCLPDLIQRTGVCTVECDPKLEPIFRRSFPAAQILKKDGYQSAEAAAAKLPDCKVAIGSLPHFFRRTRAEFPAHTGYLYADEAKVARWRAKLDRLPGRRKVGISWRGGLASSRRSLRSIPLEQWAPVLTVPGADFVSLQYVDPDRELDALGRTGIEVHEWSEAIEDYDETAALVASLDLVISVQTAIVHLAGALGTPVWALIPAAPEWRYGAAGASMVWYPAVKLVRQAVLGRWDPVIQAIAGDLREWTTSSQS